MAIVFTEAERDAILSLESNADHACIPQKVLDQLIAMGILYFRTSDGHLDFTEVGENTLKELQSVNAVCEPEITG